MIAIGVFVLAVWLGNTNLFVSLPADQAPLVLSHRGVHQTNGGVARGADSCTANPIAPVTHVFIENTIPSMRAAVAAGAHVVELDVHLTPDGVFAVFHDWTVDCRTNGTGVTHEIPFSTLRQLDVGFGYSADGLTFPLRGKGIGLLPSLADVFEADLGVSYLINFKSKDAQKGEKLAQMLENPQYMSQVFGVYGGSIPTQQALARAPNLRRFRPWHAEDMFAAVFGTWVDRICAAGLPWYVGCGSSRFCALCLGVAA